MGDMGKIYRVQRSERKRSRSFLEGYCFRCGEVVLAVSVHTEKVSSRLEGSQATRVTAAIRHMFLSGGHESRFLGADGARNELISTAK